MFEPRPGLNWPTRPAATLAGRVGCNVPPFSRWRGWEGWWVRGLKACGEVSRAEAQLRVVVNEVCGDDDMVGGSGQMPRVRPNSPWEDWNPQGKRSRPEYLDPEKGDGGGTSSRRVGKIWSRYSTVVNMLTS